MKVTTSFAVLALLGEVSANSISEREK